jgi:hypothetical protein
LLGSGRPKITVYRKIGVHNVKHAHVWKAGIVRFYVDKPGCSAIVIFALERGALPTLCDVPS